MSIASRINRFIKYSWGRYEEFASKDSLSLAAHFTIPSMLLQSSRGIEKGVSKSEKISPFATRNFASSVSSHASHSSSPPLPTISVLYFFRRRTAPMRSRNISKHWRNRRPCRFQRSSPSGRLQTVGMAQCTSLLPSGQVRGFVRRS